MRIGCLQFAPHVGDVDNNINRADSVLASAKQEDLSNLDVLILPEMAFSGEHSTATCFGPCQALAAYPSQYSSMG